MKSPPRECDHLWNDLPEDDRMRLMPYMIEAQILHIWQSKQKAIESHRRHMREVDAHLKSLESELKRRIKQCDT